MDIDDIGSTDDTALLCHTNSPLHPDGDWLAPNGTRVDGIAVEGLTRNLGSMVLTLKRTTGNPPEGIYLCFLKDNTSIFQSTYVGLYYSARGSYIN